MRRISVIGTTVLLTGALGMLSACDVDVEDKGELPEVNVEPGRAPDVDVRGPDVDVEGGKLPEYEVEKTEEGKMPSVDIDPPPEDDPQR